MISSAVLIIKAGMLLPAVIRNHQDYGVFVELIGGFIGLCPKKTFPKGVLSELRENYPEGHSVLVRVEQVDKEKERFLGAIQTEDSDENNSWKKLQGFMESNARALKELFKRDNELRPYEDMAVGSVITVSVVSLDNHGAVCETESGLKAVAYHQHFGAEAPEVGAKCQAVVLNFNALSSCLEVTLCDKLCQAVTGFKANKKQKVKLNQSIKATIQLVNKDFLLMSLNGHGSGKFVLIPPKQFNSPEIGMSSNVTLKGKYGDIFFGVIKSTEKENSTTNEQVQVEEKENVDVGCEIKVGSIIDARIKSFGDLQLNIVSNRVQGRIFITEVTDDIVEKKNPLIIFKKGDTMKAKVIGLKSLKTGSSLPITRPGSVQTRLECSLRQSKMEATNPDDLIKENLSTFIGEEMNVFVSEVKNDLVKVKVSTLHDGIISLFLASENCLHLNNPHKYFKPGYPLKATLIGKTESDILLLSCIGQVKEPKVGEQLTALIKEVKGSKTVHLRLRNGHKGIMDVFPGASEQVGKFIRCEVTSVSEFGTYHLKSTKKHTRKTSTSLLEGVDLSEKIVKETENLSSDDKEDEPPRKVRKMKENHNNVKQADSKSKEGKKTSNVLVSKPSDGDKDKLFVEGFAWGDDLDIEPVTKKEISDDDDEDATEKVTTDKKRKRTRDHEKMIENYEKHQLEGDSSPQTVNDFERLALQSPNSSVVWLGYMAYHLGLGEVAKARSVAEKALETIVFREEQEKKNVWLAYLNLEANYGDSEDLKRLMERAVTYNDPLDIHMKMCDIFVGANKLEEAEQQYNLLIRKFKKEKMVWKSYATFLYKHANLDNARNVLKRCLTALEKRDHVEVISRFANLEFSDGNPERGRTLFENLLATYPGRTDIWSVYVDMVVRCEDIEGARQLLQRATKQKMNTKKLSFLIQKFIKFEESHGTEAQVQKVKDLAVSLFDS